MSRDAELLSKDELLARLRRSLDGRSLRELAGEMGISPAFLHAVLAGKKPVGRLLPRFFGLRPVVRYERDPAARRK